MLYPKKWQYNFFFSSGLLSELFLSFSNQEKIPREEHSSKCFYIPIYLFFSYGTLCEKSSVWWTGGPSQLCYKLCPTRRLRRAAPRPKPDICNHPSGSHERRRVWIWSCIWCWWGKGEGSQSVICSPCDRRRTRGQRIWSAHAWGMPLLCCSGLESTTKQP